MQYFQSLSSKSKLQFGRFALGFFNTRLVKVVPILDVLVFSYTSYFLFWMCWCFLMPVASFVQNNIPQWCKLEQPLGYSGFCRWYRLARTVTKLQCNHYCLMQKDNTRDYSTSAFQTGFPGFGLVQCLTSATHDKTRKAKNHRHVWITAINSMRQVFHHMVLHSS